jgi:uridylate kinase
MGMLATIMNCVALQDALVRQGQKARLMSAIPVMQVADPFTQRSAVAALEDGEVVLLGGGIGNPYFTTDTAAALRALEINAEVILKATNVDGIYDCDPRKQANAVRYERVTYDEVLAKQLKVMDAAAVALCRDNHLPLIVFDLSVDGNILRVLHGEKIGTLVEE